TRFGETVSCQTPCSNDTDCGRDARCAVDQTYLSSGLGTCVASDSCPVPQVPRIVDGTTECGSQETCQGDDDCPSPAHCSLGLCTCPSGACAQSCEDDSACEADLICTDGTCALPSPCDTAQECDPDFTCSRSPTRWSA